jgi:hypothetical protein
MTESDFIIEFDKCYNKAKKYEMALPEAVLAFKILDNAGFTVQEKQLPLTKHEPVFFTQQKEPSNKQKGTNPLNKIWKKNISAICQSVFHWAKEYSEKRESAQMTECESDTVEDCNVKDEPTTNEIFIMKSLGSAVIHTAYTRTVCGEKWFYLFCKEAGEKVKTVASHRAFKFGDGNIVH